MGLVYAPLYFLISGPAIEIKWESLWLLRSKPVQAKLPATFQIFLKTVRALRVNESKLTSRNAFIFNFFALESEKDFKKDERTLLCRLPVES